MHRPALLSLDHANQYLRRRQQPHVGHIHNVRLEDRKHIYFKVLLICCGIPLPRPYFDSQELSLSLNLNPADSIYKSVICMARYKVLEALHMVMWIV